MYLPKEHHVSRLVRSKYLVRDSNDNPVGIVPQAFELRAHRDEKSLSVDWLEFFGKDHDQNIVLAIQSTRKRLTISKFAGFGIGNVEAIENACTAHGHSKVRVLYNNKKKTSSHAEIIRLPMNDNTIMQSLANEVFTKLVLNEDIP